ncbi:response regulator [Mesoterricola sediminis]|uniref:DNA-binding response regulator n=1 Tax=Mesoterricola sediminis TaxID=2927980 RepID=A0AA48GSV4_9BACT|nr:response regulator [Mesoterricola sediminis]BDU75554.1 DNA-binding response regulator [Mesoterricola sediminis]
MGPEGDLILVVDDEPQLLRFLGPALTSHGYRVLTAATAGEGERLALSHRPDAVLLDLGLPDRDGLDVVAALRGWTDIPIIVVSARGKEDDKVAALEAGANDYLTKPFGTRELIARIRVALRNRPGTAPAPVRYAFGEVALDLETRTVTRAGEKVHLTPNEYKLLVVLARNAGKVLTHNQLLKEVWGPGSAQQHHYLRVYMNQLRHKLEADPARPRHLQTELGVGYRLVEG